ncbi:MAG: DUF1501 domain-containing protein [Lentisphaeraceae bacterium]|nr:DUF1501 domain-containing protein [Lentisphaeraceae bacterium]
MKRRTFLKSSAAVSAGALLSNSQASSINGVKFPTHAPKVKRVIHLYMAGGMSHLETFDPKPMLAKMDGKAMPDSMTKGMQLAQLQGQKLVCFGPRFKFKKYGQSGLEISEALPHIGSVADDICVIRSMINEQINHDPAHTVMNTGGILNGRPSIGSWVNYALGSENDSLPGYVVMSSEGGGQAQPISTRQWNNGFLPGKFQGVKFNAAGDPVYYIGNPKGVSRDQQGDTIDTLNKLNRMLKERRNDADISTRISQYELAFRMQQSIPELADMSKEPKEILDLYGCEKPGDGSFASNCLLARRMAERGVRYIQLYHRGWDHHGGIENGVKKAASYTDKATAGLIQDLKKRDMLKDTLIIFGTEFGRTPMSQGGSGRDHHMNCFSHFLCGGGIKGGMTYGETDDLGYGVADKPVHVRDLHATILHLLGIDEKRLTVRFQGLDQRLTGVEPAKVVKGILA